MQRFDNSILFIVDKAVDTVDFPGEVITKCLHLDDCKKTSGSGYCNHVTVFHGQSYPRAADKKQPE